MNRKSVYFLPLIIAIMVGVGTFLGTKMYMEKIEGSRSTMNSNNRGNLISKSEDSSQDKDNKIDTNVNLIKSMDSNSNTDVNKTEDSKTIDTTVVNAEENNSDEFKKTEIAGDSDDSDEIFETETSSDKDISQVNISDDEDSDEVSDDDGYIYILNSNTTLEVGKKVTLRVDSSSNDDVVFSSENESVVTIDNSGLVTAQRVGSAIIVASLSGRTDSVVFNVIAKNTASAGNSNSQVVENSSNEKESQTMKNGWINKNGKKYYYKNGKFVVGWHKIDGDKYYFDKKGVMQKDTYVDYHYLKANGKKKEKIGPFSATLYGAIAWPNQTLNVRSKASINGQIVGSISTGQKVKIISDVNASTGYVKVRSGNTVGYVWVNNLMINLPDVIPDMYYSITNANKSKFKVAGTNISGVTGENLYGFNKKYNAKIGKTTYYAPMLYPVAVQLQSAYNKAIKQGYNLKVYDTYRPYDVSMSVASNLRSLYNSNSQVRNKVDYDSEGNYWGQGWFIAQGVSGHNRGTDIDLALTDSNGKELSAQSPMHTLDTSSLVKYNNDVSKKLRSIMTSVGFETLKSEWWHFQEDSYRDSPYVSFKLK